MIFLKKITLFLNAFLIMNILFLGKEIYLYFTDDSYKNNCVLIGIIFIIIFIIGGLLGLIFILKKQKRSYVLCKVLHKENRAENYYFGYFSLFVLLFLSFDLSNVANLICFIIVFFMLALVYCRNDLLYINPTLLLFKKRIYNVKIDHNNKEEIVLVLTNVAIEVGKTYKFYYSPLEFTTCEELPSK